MATAAQLKEIRRRAGIGEFAGKAKPSTSTKSSGSSPSSGSKNRISVWDWNVKTLMNRFGGSSPDVLE